MFSETTQVGLRRATRALAVVGTAALVGTGLMVTGAAQAATGCSVSYAVTSSWAGGFVAGLTITNLGTALTSWNLTWSFTAGQVVTAGWNATFTQSGVPGVVDRE